MAGCCPSRDYHRFFNQRFARRLADRYRKRGLDKTAQTMVEFLRTLGIEGASILEIGGGVGEIQVELLKAGAARAQNLELSPAYEQPARTLAEQAGVQGRLDWRIHDLAQDPGTVAPADLVVLHRVVCCYPDYERLLAAAADHARRALVFSYPPRNALTRRARCWRCWRSRGFGGPTSAAVVSGRSLAWNAFHKSGARSTGTRQVISAYWPGDFARIVVRSSGPLHHRQCGRSVQGSRGLQAAARRPRHRTVFHAKPRLLAQLVILAVIPQATTATN
jgi:Methyltransferase domain